MKTSKKTSRKRTAQRRCAVADGSAIPCSDTPKTDEHIKALHDEGAYSDPSAISVDFARELERENAKLYARLAVYEELLRIAANNAHDSGEEESFEDQINAALSSPNQ